MTEANFDFLWWIEILKEAEIPILGGSISHTFMNGVIILSSSCKMETKGHSFIMSFNFFLHLHSLTLCYAYTLQAHMRSMLLTPRVPVHSVPPWVGIIIVNVVFWTLCSRLLACSPRIKKRFIPSTVISSLSRSKTTCSEFVWCNTGSCHC